MDKNKVRKKPLFFSMIYFKRLFFLSGGIKCAYAIYGKISYVDYPDSILNSDIFFMAILLFAIVFIFPMTNDLVRIKNLMKKYRKGKINLEFVEIDLYDLYTTKLILADLPSSRWIVGDDFQMIVTARHSNSLFSMVPSFSFGVLLYENNKYYFNNFKNYESFMTYMEACIGSKKIKYLNHETYELPSARITMEFISE